MRTTIEPGSADLLVGMHANIVRPVKRAGAPYDVPSSTSGSVRPRRLTRAKPSSLDLRLGMGSGDGRRATDDGRRTTSAVRRPSPVWLMLFGRGNRGTVGSFAR